MPEAAAVNDCYQVRLIGSIEGQQTVNVFHFKCTGADDDVLTHLVLVFAQCFIDHMLPVLSSAWTLVEIRWKKVSPTLGIEFISVPVGAGAGAGSASALPSYSSVVFSLRTETGGRSHRGRNYFAGIPEDATIGSKLDPEGEFWAAALAFALCVVTNFIPGDPPGAPSWAMMVYSRKIGGDAFPYGAGGFTQMKEYVPAAYLGTTRSRKVGRGS